MASKSKDYGNNSISSIKGADRVRLRPAVIFGSDGIDGCRHSVFEIVSNAVDEAGAGYGNLINVTAYKDLSICVEDFGRGVPLGYNEAEGRYNWELVYCELYAGGKYNVAARIPHMNFLSDSTDSAPHPRSTPRNICRCARIATVKCTR